MSDKLLGEIIRTKKDEFKTPNLRSYSGDEMVEVFNENFRRNQQDQELILFFEYQGELYFPVWFEFRSINNNLLFLFCEYGIKEFSTLVKILSSSLEKEERYQTVFKAIVYKTKNKPSFVHPLPGFMIESSDRIFVEET